MGRKNLNIVIALILPCAVLILAFNNCGGPKGQSSESSASLIPTPPRTNSPPTDSPPPTISRTGFKAGDMLSKSELETVSSKLATFYDSYSVSTNGLKGMAITSDGVDVVGAYGYTQNESGFESYLVSICNARFQKRCVILAKGSLFAVNHSDLDNFKKSPEQSGSVTAAIKGRSIEEASFPIYRGSQSISDYVAKTDHKAMALGWSGALYYYSSPTLTEAELSRMTFEGCQLATLKKCVILAQGNVYAWDYKTDKMNWTLPTAGQTLDLSKIPLVSDKYRADAQASVYNSKIAGGAHGVLYLVQGGECSNESF